MDIYDEIEEELEDEFPQEEEVYDDSAILRERELRRRIEAKKRRELNTKVTICAAAVLLLIILLAVWSKKSDEKFENEDSSSEYIYVPKEPVPEQEVQNTAEYAGLYYLGSYSGYYAVDPYGNAQFDYQDGSIEGLFTGKKSDKYEGMIELDWSDTKVLVYSSDAMKIDNAKVLPLGAFSQHTYNGSGESGCGAACLHMLLGGDYEELLTYADMNGFADQGSLNSLSGGMTIESMTALAKAYYGKEMVNAYTDAELPSVTVKRLIDEGHCVVALVKLGSYDIEPNGFINHFVVINGYTESEDGLTFIYANSYTNSSEGFALDSVSADKFDRAAVQDFGESKTVAYIK